MTFLARTSRLLLPAVLLLAGAVVSPAQATKPGMTVLAGGHDTWWKHAVLYEIYPRSFQDTNGDGTGDLNGITQRLDYLKGLGIDAIWIAPMFPSPQVDFGYDISDYNTVDPQYGTLADMDKLIAEAKKRNIRIMLDMVLNHTSDKHAWFEESKSSLTNPKRDWYVWADGTGPNKTDPPNNWQSVFGHSAWKYDETTKQFYYHKFYAEQPDLNWRNPVVEKSMFDVLRFWLDRGVAGFRLDAIPTLFENPDMKDETPELDASGKTTRNPYGDTVLKDSQTNNLPEVHGVLQRMRKLVDSYPGDRVLVGETYLQNVGDLDKMYGGAAKDELQLPMDMQVGFLNKFDVATMRKNIADAETMIHGSQPLFVIDNHDNARTDRYCTPAATGHAVTSEQCDAIEKMLATLLFTAKSTALMYYGDEIGMKTTPPARKEDVKDPIGILGWPVEKGRDGDRTPMQWNTSANAGFTTSATPWLPVPPNFTSINVATEKSDPGSILEWYTGLIALRRNNPAVHSGTLTMLDTTNDKVLAYELKEGSHTVVVALNFTDAPQTLSLGEIHATTLMQSPGKKIAGSVTSVSLLPYGSWVGEGK
jgi:alpha-glucosidase